MDRKRSRVALLVLAGLAVAVVIWWMRRPDDREPAAAAHDEPASAPQRAAAPRVAAPTLELPDDVEPVDEAPQAPMSSAEEEELLRSGEQHEVTEQVPAPSEANAPVVTDDSPTLESTPEYKREKTALIVSHLERRIERLRREIEQPAAPGGISVEQKRAVLERLEARLEAHRKRLDEPEDE